MALIENDLEKQCRKLIARGRSGNSLDPSLFMQREIALTLDHLDRSRYTTQSMLREVDESASAVRHRILNIGNVPYQYAVGIHHENDKVRNKLRDTQMRIEMNRRGILIEYNRDLQKLQGRLLSLWNKHEMLTPSHGSRTNGP